MKLKLSKYSANGNDFVIFHTFIKRDLRELATQLCDRTEGIGADGLIGIVPHAQHAYEWQFYNRDGSIGEMCGNGSRACAHYAYTHGLCEAKHRFLTVAGLIDTEVEGDFVRVGLTPYTVMQEPFSEMGHVWQFYDTGVPHLVTYVEDINAFDTELARHMRYAHNANVNFASIHDDGTIDVRTYERGVEDETLACGTGMCAAFLGAFRDGKIGSEAEIFPKSRESVIVTIDNDRLSFRGRVVPIFDTVVTI